MCGLFQDYSVVGSFAMKLFPAQILFCMIAVLFLSAGPRSANAHVDDDSAHQARGESTLTPIQGAFTSSFAPYEPVYLAVGWRGGTNAKFQLSFRYRLAQHLYFAYTQTSVWDLGIASAPFRDSSYRPAFFYFFNEAGAAEPAGDTWFGMAAGFEHESNGKAPPDSRSLNILYLWPIYAITKPEHSRLRIAPKVWYYMSSSENPDIADYRGYVNLLIVYDMIGGFGFLDGLQISASMRKGTEKHYGSIQVDLSYPLGPGYVHAQYFSGYGETILNYNQRFTSQIRLGYMLVRW